MMLICPIREEGRRPTGRQSDTKDDERRLFGDYRFVYGCVIGECAAYNRLIPSAGPNPVRIRPGETSTKNKSLKVCCVLGAMDTI